MKTFTQDDAFRVTGLAAIFLLGFLWWKVLGAQSVRCFRDRGDLVPVLRGFCLLWKLYLLVILFLPFMMLPLGQVSLEGGLPWWTHFTFFSSVILYAPLAMPLVADGCDEKDPFHAEVKIPLPCDTLWTVHPSVVWAYRYCAILLRHADDWTDALACAIAFAEGHFVAGIMTGVFCLSVLLQISASVALLYVEKEEDCSDQWWRVFAVQSGMFHTLKPPRINGLVHLMVLTFEDVPQFIMQLRLQMDIDNGGSLTVWISIALSFAFAVKAAITGLATVGFCNKTFEEPPDGES